MRGQWGKQRGDIEVATKYQAKSQGEPSGPAQYKHVFLRDKVLLALYKFCFQQFDKEERFRYIQQDHP